MVTVLAPLMAQQVAQDVENIPENQSSRSERAKTRNNFQVNIFLVATFTIEFLAQIEILCLAVG